MKALSLPVDLNTLSHELRTPLVGILGIAEHLNEEVLSPNQKEQITLIEESGKRLLNFINKILTSTKTKAYIRN